MLITFLQLELVSYDRIAPARIDQIFGAEFAPNLSVSRVGHPGLLKIANAQCHAVVIEGDVIYGSFFANFCARFAGMIEQHFIEFGPRHLVGTIRPGSEPILKIKLGRFLSSCFRDFAAKFFDKMRAQFFLQTEPGKCLHAERQKRFTDVETRKFLAFEDNDTTPRFAQQRCRGAAGGPAADDRYVIVFHHPEN